MRRRCEYGSGWQRDLGISLSYVFMKSLDDASSLGGGSVVVAQNPYDISADRGLSSFDQTQKFTGTWMYDLPFGDGKRFLTQRPPLSCIRWMAMERGFHNSVGILFHAPSAGGFGGHQSRCERLGPR